MKIDTLEKFLQEITYLDKNTDIYKIYRSFLSDCIDSSRFSFIVGTNDFLGVKNSNKLREFHGTYDLEGGKNKIYVYDSISDFDYILHLDKDFTEQIPIYLHIVLDANLIGIFSNFIETNGEISNSLIEKILNSDNIDIDFLFYMFEDTLNPDKSNQEKSLKKIENLCKFKSIYKDEYRKSKTLKINEHHSQGIYSSLINNASILRDSMICDYNFIYSYLILAYIEKISNNFDLEKSALNVYNLMKENGTKFIDLFCFIYEYLSKNTSDSFFKIDKNSQYDSVVKTIKSMSWDIFYYYSSRHFITQNGMSDVKFAYPIFATTDKAFTQNYRNFFNHKIGLIENTIEGKKFKSISLINEEILDFFNKFNVDQIQNANSDEKQEKSKQLKQMADDYLKKVKGVY